MPLYNSSKFLKESINSVINQTYNNWELLIVDDGSTDESYEIATEYQKNDNRIRVYKLKKNYGAATARNLAIEKASGRFFSFLDADDLWDKDKLEKQLSFMLDNNYYFTCASYRVISEDGMHLSKEVKMLEKVNYTEFLSNNLLQTVGIMIDTSKVSKELIIMPNVKRRQDAATWLQILDAGIDCYGCKRVLCSYRRVSNSLSSNKIKAAKGMWFLYREIEKLSLIQSTYFFSRYALLAVWKRLYF